MSDAPVCHYGPTSSRYVDITRLIVPWNPFYQEAVIKIFDSVFNNAINYQQQAVCAFTVAISVIAKQCGWESITKKECQLVGCCYDDTRKYCAYPQQNVLANFNIQEYYPELIARPGESTTCPSSNGLQNGNLGLLGGLSGLGGVGLPGIPGPGLPRFNPSMFNRLPCQSTNTTTVFNTLLTCPSIGCCINTMAFLPGISGL
uniref:P-type domain-containing protein n=1 Tax=Ciona savignyi TaxID=51511 RepID=H2YT56_CIOSA